MHVRPILNRALFVGAAALFAAACGETPQHPTDTDPTVAAVQPEPGDVAAALVVHKRHTPDLMNIEGVVGTGLGVDGEKPSIRVFTVHGNVRGIPDHVDNVPVERVVTGLIVAGDINNPASRERPAPNGFSIGHPDITAGTMGAIVRDADDVCYALSNNHVLANSNDASIGDNALQPGPFDGGSDPADAIGTLADFEPISFSSNNQMDAAIAELFDASTVTGSTPDFAYGTPGTSTVGASVGMNVQKFGRTTAHTTGHVAEIGVTVSVCYVTRGPFNCASAATFVDQFTIEPGTFSAGGDSGSLIVTDNGSANPVGLLFAGSDTRTIANPIDPVLGRFNAVIEPNTANCSNGDGGDPPPDDGNDPPGSFTLSVSPFKERGVQHADLTWEGAGSTNVDVFRDGNLVTTTANDGAHTDNIGNRGGGTYAYQVCEAGTSTCSNEATARF